MPLILEIVSLGKSARESAGGCEHCLSASRTVNAFIKDQVTPMLFSKHIVSTRTLFQLTVALVFLFVAAVGAAVAANSGNPPMLVPYTMNVVAGNPEYTSSSSSPAIQSGYGGDINFKSSVGYAVPFVYSGTMGTPNTGTLASPAAGTSTAKVAPGASLSSPYGFAVDSVGNIYIADKGNDLVREVNYQTGLINIVAGMTPNCGASPITNTLATYSCSSFSGCADGLPAYQGKIGGGIEGVAVDSFGNVYFIDNSSSTASVVYRGGTRVADFIKRVNPAAVAASPGGVVTVGYVYHIAGEINLKTCTGSKTNSVTSSVIDNAPAFEDTNNQAGTSGTFPPPPGATVTYGATLNGPSNISLDSAGNIYISDIGDGTTRVINTQETPQTFFQYTIPPGYMRSIVNCSTSLTIACTTVGGTPTTYVGTGINAPVNALVYGSDYQYSSADAYGNIYQVNTKGASPGIYASVAYAGGAPLSSLLAAETPQLSSVYSANETAYPTPSSDLRTPNELPLTYGNAYIVGGQPATAVLPGAFLNISAVTSEELVIRPTSWVADSFGTQWYYDNHYPEVFRIDQYTATATGIFWGDALTGSPVRGTTAVSGLSASGLVGNAVVSSNGTVSAGTVSNYNTASPATFTNTWNCVYGASSAPWLYGPQTFDPEGDGCPSAVVKLNGGNFYTISDGLGNVYIGDSADEIIHEATVGTQFPATPVGTATPVTQAIQVHFDASSIPVTGGAGSTVSIADGPSLGYTTTSFSVAADTGDFSLDQTTQEFPLGSLLVPITGLPLGFGESTLTPNFSMYPTQSMLQNGQPALPTCTQLGTNTGDNTWDCLVYVKFNPTGVGMRTGQLVATTANGSVYDFQLTGVGTGAQLAIDGGSQTTVAATGLGNTSSIAINSAGTVYIADAKNNRIVVEPTPVSFTGTLAIGSTTVTSVTNIANLAVGEVVAAPLNYIPVSPTNTTISAINAGAGTITLSAAPTNSGVGLSLTAMPVPTVSIGSSASPMTGVTPATLSGPMGVAVDAANNLYIADTGNNRILKYNPITGAATVLGNYLWVPGATCDTAGSQASDCVFQGYATQAPTTIPYSLTAVPPITNPNSIVSNLGASGSSSAVSILNEPGAYVGLTAANTASPIVGTNQSSYTIPGTTGTTAPPQYTFKAPQGIAVDTWGNVYVADTGNAAVVLIPSNTNLGGATPLMQYPGAPTFGAPVAVAIGAGPGPKTSPANYPSNAILYSGYIYVADQIYGVFRIPPGGGDLQPVTAGNTTSAMSVLSALPQIGGNSITTPNGVAVDAAGNVYISDSGSNTVWEAPAVGNNNASAFPTFALSFTGLNAPAGLALDANGNVYVADSLNSQVLFMDRQNPVANFPSGNYGNVPQDLGLTGTTGTPTPSGISGTPAGCPVLGGGSACTGVLTVSNIGNSSATLIATPATLSGSSEYSITTPGHLTTCVAGAFPAGNTCTISPLFTPTADGSATGTVVVNGTQSVALVATGVNPEINLSLAASPTTGLTVQLGTTVPNSWNVAPGTPVTLTATANQPHIAGAAAPTGTVVFTITIDQGTPYNTTSVANGCGAPIVSPAETLVVSGSSSTATYTFTPAAGLSYTVNALFTPGAADTTDSTTLAQTPIGLTTPAVETATDTNGTFVYGCSTGCTAGNPPAPIVPIGSLTPALPSGVTAKWTSNATQFSAVASSPYNIQVSFYKADGSPACSYGSPIVSLTGSATTQAVISETPAPLTVYVPPYVAPATFTGTTTAGSNTITSVSSTTGVAVGALAVGTGIPAGTTITAINSTVTFTGTTTTGNTSINTTTTFTGTTTTGSNVITSVSSTTGVAVGGLVSGTGIPTGTAITAINSTAGTITLSVNATASGSTTITSVYIPTGVAVGAPISGNGIPAGTTITAVNSTAGTLTLSASATASGPTTVTVLGALTLSANATASGTATVTIDVPAYLTPYGASAYAFAQVAAPRFGAGGITTTGLVGYDRASASFSLTSNGPAVNSSTLAVLYVTGTTTPGNTQITAVSSTTGLVAGEPVAGIGIPTGATIASTGTTTITLSVPVATYTGTTISGSATIISMSYTAGLSVGEAVSGPGIPTGATIASIGTGTITLSANATATAVGVTITTPPLAGVVIQGSYPLFATMTGKAISAGDYTVTLNPPTTGSTGGWDIVTQAPAAITVTPTKASVSVTGVYPTTSYITPTAANLTAATFPITVGTLVPAGNGTPTGTISVTDNFVPITSTVLIPTPTTGMFPLNAAGGVSWPAASGNYPGTQTILPCATVGQTTPLCNPVLTLSSGAATFTIPNANGAGNVPPLGTHYLSFAYSGDTNFICTVIGQQATASCPSTALVPYVLVVDNMDFTMTDTLTSPLNVSPGIVPSQNGLPALPNQSSSNAESTIVTIGGFNSFVGNIVLTCASSAPTYLSCFIGQLQVVNNGVQTSNTVTMAVSNDTGLAVVFSAQTPAQLPIGFNTTAQLRTTATRTVLAFLPFGILAFCVRRRRRLSKALWMLIAIAMVSVGMSGCGGNLVDFYTPVPLGPQSVVITGAYTNTTTPSLSVTRTLTIPINII